MAEAPHYGNAGGRWLAGTAIMLALALGGTLTHLAERVAGLESRERYTHEQLDRIERLLARVLDRRAAEEGKGQ